MLFLKQKCVRENKENRKIVWWRNVFQKIVFCKGRFFVGAIILGLDQGIKFLFALYIRVCNEGHAFGWQGGGNITGELSMVFILFFIGYKTFLSYKNKEADFLGWSLLFFGGLSNGIDRILFGCVRDIFPFFGYFFWNVADGIILLGVILLIWKKLFTPSDVVY